MPNYEEGNRILHVDIYTSLFCTYILASFCFLRSQKSVKQVFRLLLVVVVVFKRNSKTVKGIRLRLCTMIEYLNTACNVMFRQYIIMGRYLCAFLASDIVYTYVYETVTGVCPSKHLNYTFVNNNK